MGEIVPLYSIHCSLCEYETEEIVKLADLDAFDEKLNAECPLCARPNVCRRVITKAPLTRMGGEGSTRQIHDMRRSFQERFWKGGGADEVRHKHGEAFDDALRGAAVTKIKEQKGEL